MVVIPEMYEESGCFDPSSMQGGLAEDGFSQTHVVSTTTNCNPSSFSMEEQQHSSHHQNLSHQVDDDAAAAAAAAAMAMEIQQLNSEMEIQNDQNHHMVMQEMVQHDQANHILPCGHDQSNWDDMSYNTYHHHHHNQDPQAELQNLHHHQQILNASSLPDTLLNMFPLPRCSTSSLLQPNSSTTTFMTSLGLIGDLPTVVDGGASASTTVVYDPLLPLNLPPQPPLLRELFHSLPHGYDISMGGSRSGSLFSGVDDGEALSNGGFYQDGDGRPTFANGVFEFTAVKGKDGKDTKHFATERQRRVHLNDKYKALKSLVPNPTKNDRASIVGYAIEYINELKRTVNDLKILVDKKRRSRERMKRQKTEEGSIVEVGDHIKTEDDLDQPYNNGSSAFRSSWLHRKSKNTEVDVRIIDDEVTVKLVQQKRINCLLFVSKVLDELQLDLHHVAGGLIGDYYSFLFNSKICEGSTIYAHAIANKLIDVVDKQYAAIPPINSY